MKVTKNKLLKALGTPTKVIKATFSEEEKLVYYFGKKKIEFEYMKEWNEVLSWVIKTNNREEELLNRGYIFGMEDVLKAVTLVN